MLLIVISLNIVGCSINRNADTENVQISTTETELGEDNSKVYPDTKMIKLTGAEEKTIFTEAVNNATQMAGIVNMGSPHYQFMIGDEAYFLWISKDSGSIMNRKDTHTLYLLAKNSAREIIDFINTSKY